MKYSTANVKHGDYKENHVVYIGTQTGSFKSKLRITANISQNSNFKMCKK